MLESVFFLCGRTAQSVNSRVCPCALARMFVHLSFKACNDLGVIGCLCFFLPISRAELSLRYVAQAEDKRTYYILYGPVLLMCEQGLSGLDERQRRASKSNLIRDLHTVRAMQWVLSLIQTGCRSHAEAGRVIISCYVQCYFFFLDNFSFWWR